MSPAQYLAYLQKHFAPPGYRSDRMQVSDALLERFAERILRSRGYKPGERYRILKQQLIENLKKRHQTPVPTPYEIPILRSLLVGLVNDVRAVARRNRLRLPRNIVFGVLPTGEVNAMVIQVPSGRGAVVAVDLGTFLYVHLMAKAISSFIPYAGMNKRGPSFRLGRREIERGFRSNPDAHKRFLEVLTAYLLFGNPARAPQYWQRGPHHPITALLRDTAEMFIVAHEYAHLILGHIRIRRNTRTRSIRKGLKITNISVHRWEQEILADNLALQVVVDHNLREGFPFRLAYWGVDFFLSAIDFVDRANGISDTKTHPSARKRRHLIRWS